jgi:hypothetical protein
MSEQNYAKLCNFNTTVKNSYVYSFFYIILNKIHKKSVYYFFTNNKECLIN